MVKAGYRVFPVEEGVMRWTQAAYKAAIKIAQNPERRAANLRHGDTWFVGVDALPNDDTGAIGGVPLCGSWRDAVPLPTIWHRAQLSILYPGYPRQDTDESDANHRYRRVRFAAHVDGLLPIGPERRRYLKEPHGFILGLPLNAATAAPLMVYPGSHAVMGRAFRAFADAADPAAVDLTEIYQKARREVFDTIDPVPVQAPPGAAILLHRHLLHGVAPWPEHEPGPSEGRMIAYFRPQFAVKDWF